MRKSNLFKPVFVESVITIMPLGGKSTESISSYIMGFLEVCKLSFGLYNLLFVLILFSKVIIIIYKNLKLSKYSKDLNKNVLENL